jgi:hypothetical protein
MVYANKVLDFSASFSDMHLLVFGGNLIPNGEAKSSLNVSTNFFNYMRYY